MTEYLINQIMDPQNSHGQKGNQTTIIKCLELKSSQGLRSPANTDRDKGESLSWTLGDSQGEGKTTD